MKADMKQPAGKTMTPMTREEFLRCFESLATEFAARQREVSADERAFFQALGRCQAAAQRQPLADSRLEQGHALHSLVPQLTGRIREIFDDWKKKIDARDTQAKFKERLQDSLLVFVYGKVKAGKSSLGNYVAWGDPDPEPRAHPAGTVAGEPAFFVHDSTQRTETTSGDEIRERRRFKVGRTETTSAIQGFTLPGLTWVDSPGLHSKTEDNGELARQYVDAADLVLYLTSSTAPCKRSDLEELEELGGKEHNLAVIISGSDMVDEDEDEHGELVKVRTMKSRADRDEQVGYARSSLDEQARADGADTSRIVARTLQRAQVFSISVAYACEHADAAGVALSGVGGMFHHLADLARSEGVRSKQIQPLKNLRAFLLGIRDEDIVELKEHLQQCRAAADGARTKARADSEAACKRRIDEIGHEVDELVRKHAMKDADFRAAIGEAQRRWFPDLVRNATAAYEATMESALPDALDNIAQQIPGFEQRMGKTPRKRRLRVRQGRVIGGLLFSLGAVVFSGGMALAAGVALGAFGSWVGGQVGGLFDDHDLVTTPSGDNTQEVGDTTRKLLLERLQSRTALAIDALDHSCFHGLLDWVDGLQEHASRLEKESGALLAQIDERIARHDAGAASTSPTHDDPKENP